MTSLFHDITIEVHARFKSLPLLLSMDTRRCCMSDCWTKEARNRQAPVKVLATGTNTTFLDTLCKIRQQWIRTCASLQLAKQLYRFMRRHFPSRRHGGRQQQILYSLCLRLRLHKSCERDSEQTNEFFWGAVDQLVKQDVVNAHVQAPQFWNAAPHVCCLHNQYLLATLLTIKA